MLPGGRCPPRSSEEDAVTVSQIRAAATKMHYAWIIAALTFAVLFLGAGVRAAPGGLIGPFAAALMDRFGVRRTMSLALALTAAAVALTAAMREAWQMVLLWGLVVGAGTGVIGSYLSAYMAARWFRVRQGLVIGVLTAANAAGQLVFLPTMAELATAAGWRAMSLTLAGLVIASVPPLLWLMRERPADLGLAPYGAVGEPRAEPASVGNPLALAL